MVGQLSTSEIEELLGAEVVARIGCHAGGRTYVVPVTYAYDGEGICFQSHDGLKMRMMRENPSVCVEVEHVDDLANWRSVIAWGHCEVLVGDAATAAFARIRARLQAVRPGQTTPAGEDLHPGETPVRSGNGQGTICRIDLVEKTGRFERR